MDLGQLHLLFPLCRFRKSILYDKQFYVYFDSHNIRITHLLSTWDIDMFTHIYNTIDYVIQFLKANYFEFHYNSTELLNIITKNNIEIRINANGYNINYNSNRLENETELNADELISIIKKELCIETSYKPVLE